MATSLENIEQIVVSVGYQGSWKCFSTPKRYIIIAKLQIRAQVMVV